MSVFGLIVSLAACGPTRPAEDAGPAPDAGVALHDAAAVDGGTPPSDLVDVVAVSAHDTGASGEIAITVPISAQRSFMVVGTTETNARLSVLSIEDPSGATILRWEDWYNGSRGLTNAFFASRPATVINWPVRAEDPPLVPGDYVVRVGSYRVDGITSRPDIPVEVTTLISRDADLDDGLVRVAIVWADGLSGDAALVAATEDAVAHWREVWTGASMQLDVRYVDSAIDPALPYPSATTGDMFLQASLLAEPGEIVVVIGEIIDDNPTQYGVAGQLPGPLVPSTLSAIVVGWLANAGGDGVFSDNDIQLYGEVLAHEVGHYLGLFHPVESAYDYWDALADTPECGAERQCEDTLGENLMFPYSICDAGTCLSTTVITSDQRAVMQRYTGTL